MHNKNKLESPFHIAKRVELATWKKVLIKIGAGLVALLLCGIISQIVGCDFGTFFEQLILGNFGTPRRILILFETLAILLMVSLAVTPAFKMRFWNIGAEGQVLMGALLCYVAMHYFGGKIPDGLLVVICLAFAIVGGGVWGAIPAIFKAKWNTNETLFTLMLNYIASGLIVYLITIWAPTGSGSLGVEQYGHLPLIGGQRYVFNIIIVAIFTVLMFVYLKYSKHGYELSVVGESVNTAKYVGINVRGVIVRTMVLSGILCGIAGFLLVCGADYTISANTAGGRGFTAILVSWLAGFNPAIMAVMAFLVAFISQGAKQVATISGFRNSFADIMTAIFFFGLIASNFFISYKLKVNKKFFERFKKKVEAKTEEIIVESDNSEDKKEDAEESTKIEKEGQLEGVSADSNEEEGK